MATIEVEQLTISLPLEVKTALQKRASAIGKDVKIYVEDLLKKQVTKPSLDEILAPFRREVEESRISDDEFDEFVEEIRDEIHQEKIAELREK